MPTFNQLREYTQRVRQVDPDGYRWLQAHNREIVAAGQRAQTVVDHPGWQEFVRRIEEALALAERTRESAVAQLLTMNTLGDDALALKLKIREMDGARGAYASALAMIPALLKEAATAAEALRA